MESHLQKGGEGSPLLTPLVDHSTRFAEVKSSYSPLLFEFYQTDNCGKIEISIKNDMKGSLSNAFSYSRYITLEIRCTASTQSIICITVLLLD